MTSKSRKTTSQAVKPEPGAAAKPQSKAETIIALLKRDGGATLDEMMTATGWQKHSVRGFMAGALKKQHRLSVSSTKTERGRSYRLAGEAQS